jgi:putative endonuclease
MTNNLNSTLYTGMTDDIIRRVYEHKNELIEGFTKKYKLHKLVYYEECNNALPAIEREKQLKRWHRDWKINLIKSTNPELKDLYNELVK